MLDAARRAIFVGKDRGGPFCIAEPRKFREADGDTSLRGSESRPEGVGGRVRSSALEEPNFVGLCIDVERDLRLRVESRGSVLIARRPLAQEINRKCSFGGSSRLLGVQAQGSTAVDVLNQRTRGRELGCGGCRGGRPCKREQNYLRAALRIKQPQGGEKTFPRVIRAVWRDAAHTRSASSSLTAEDVRMVGQLTAKPSFHSFV